MINPVEFVSADLNRIRLDLRQYRVKAECKVAGRPYNYRLDLSGHALSRPMCEFLRLHGPAWPAGTIVGYSQSFARLIEFCNLSRSTVLRAETFAGYLNWMRSAKHHRSDRFVEITRRVYGNLVLRFMEWLVETGSLKASEAHAARLRHRKAFKGFNARQLQALRANAVPPDDYVRLIRAVRLEFEESGNVLKHSQSKQDTYDKAFPLLPFSILLGAIAALRSVEFNNLTVGDLRGDRLLLNPPDKPSSEIWLSPDLMASFELARHWMARYRRSANVGDPLLVIPMKSGPRSKMIVRFDTMCLARGLKAFYEKYFNLLDKDGLPYLFSNHEDDFSRPLLFSLSFRGLRSAAITEAAREEKNPEAVMRFARHLSFDTTLKYYVHETHRQWVENIATYLAPSAERFRISLENKIAKPKMARAARLAGAIVPGGHCEQALAGDQSCLRSIDCRLCQFYRIHPSRREYFVAEREGALRDAVSLSTENGLERDAQNLRQFAALNEAIINRIDDHVSTRT